MVPRALSALARAEVVIGYGPYIKSIADLLDGKEVLASAMKKEIDRARRAVEMALQGRCVAVVSSGDPGVYGMAGLIMEVAPPGLIVEVVPGVSSGMAAAANLGAPLMHDFAAISLSDLLTPWHKIQARLEAVGAADFVVVLYNPRSRGRPEHIREAQKILLRYRRPSTPAGVVRNAQRENMSVIISTLEDLPVEMIEMNTTVIIGNSETRVINGLMVTPRGYQT